MQMDNRIYGNWCKSDNAFLGEQDCPIYVSCGNRGDRRSVTGKKTK